MSADDWVAAVRAALEPLAQPADAPAMSAYMRNVAPVLGIRSPDRRRAVLRAVRGRPTPSVESLREIALNLWAEPEREFHYAACDVLARFSTQLDESFLVHPTERLLTTAPWWDTVDSLGTAVVSQLTARFPSSITVMWRWCRSDDRWLIRAAIQHQRGRREGTDIDLLTSMCALHAQDREFFVAKAIGWALRDASRWYPGDVRKFLDTHAGLTPVARREAERGLARFG